MNTIFIPMESISGTLENRVLEKSSIKQLTESTSNSQLQ